MKPNNGDLPAMPTIYADMATNGQREIYCDQTGLTKRELFAMNAPDAIPEWFAPGVQDTGVCGIYFAWRSFYADRMLIELDRTK